MYTGTSLMYWVLTAWVPSSQSRLVNTRLPEGGGGLETGSSVISSFLGRPFQNFDLCVVDAR